MSKKREGRGMGVVGKPRQTLRGQKFTGHKALKTKPDVKTTHSRIATN